MGKQKTLSDLEQQIENIHKAICMLIITKTCDCIGVTVEQFNSDSRKRKIVMSRQIVSKILTKKKYNPTEINRFTRLDRATIYNYLTVFQNMYDTETSYRNKYNEILNILKLQEFQIIKF
jgi:chromosomal replication initiation ATPase DnaA